MKINFQYISCKDSTLKQYFVKMLVEKSKDFLQENDICYDTHKMWPIFDYHGLTEYSKWLVQKSIITSEVYSFKNDEDKPVALGLDIQEDKLYSLHLLKVNSTDD